MNRLIKEETVPLLLTVSATVTSERSCEAVRVSVSLSRGGLRLTKCRHKAGHAGAQHHLTQTLYGVAAAVTEEAPVKLVTCRSRPSRRSHPRTQGRRAFTTARPRCARRGRDRESNLAEVLLHAGRSHSNAALQYSALHPHSFPRTKLHVEICCFIHL